MSIPDTPVPDNLTSDTAINDPAIPSKCSSFIKGIFDSLPIVVSCISISFTFRLNAVKLGFTSSEAISGKKTAIWVFGLTDEVFAAATTKLIKNQRNRSENWLVAIAICLWLPWVLGTVSGALLGNSHLDSYPAVEATMTFMLSAILAGIVTGCLVALIQAHITQLGKKSSLLLGDNRTPGKKIGKTGIILNSIGVASICSLLIVAGLADVIQEHNKFFPTLIGCFIIYVFFYKTHSIIFSTLSRSANFGLTFKVFMN
ncbi:AzlC family ABC transporter permease [Xenorhabdus sp. Flor]|uniref:AzlC family ABC transporter permease n=1 Tax=Xenorhabdus cabanillasii TaxID=351673 RepID=UPI0019C26DD4|nr:AzlC family ABC transporter permease [Xenorhabdus sp. Flor]MBD2815441.1 AzlC family ABC transporter permease [Xenorhabdus sp. Flor]